MDETRYQRIGREQRERQEARAKRQAAITRKPRRSHNPANSARARIADRIDGFDRDDLGHSPDF